MNIGLSQLASQLLDSLLPPTCLSCQVVTASPHGLCADCWGHLDFVTAPQCAVCGIPFEFEIERGAICGQCLKTPPAFTWARAPLVYGDGCRNLLLAFKHGDRAETAPFLAKLIHNTTRELISGCDVIVPVPLHWTRLFSRRFNQAALIARELGAQSGLPICQNTLKRIRRTRTQGGLSANGRRKNLRRAFAVPADREAAIKGKKVLLVDDVFTTGATVEACCRTLLQAGAESVSVVTVARAFKER